MSSKARRLGATTHVDPFSWGGTRVAVAPTTAGRSHASIVHDPATSVADVDKGNHEARVAEMEREAFAKGFAQGEKSGQEAADQRGEAMLRRLTETLKELTELRSRVIHQAERQMVELALAVARRVLHREVSLDQDLLVAMARVALDRLGEAAKITVRLNPEDHQRTGASKVSQLSSASVNVVADNRIPRGGCRVESEMGILDAGIDAQLHEIAQALLGRAEAPTDARAA